MNIYTSTNSLEEFFSETTQIQETIYYNYIYFDPRKPGQYCYEGLNMSFLYEPFYVGKGKNNRKYDHLKLRNLNRDSNKLKVNKIKKIINETYNLKEYILQINSHLTNQQSKDIEVDLISKIGRLNINIGPLTNLTKGGDGVNGIIRKEAWNKCKTMKELYGENWINSRLGKTYKELCGDDWISPIIGKTRKEINGENWVDPRLGKTRKEISGDDYIHYFTGKKHSPEAKLKISENSKKLKHSNEVKKIMSESKKGNNNPRAKKWKIISPNDDIFIIEGDFQNFCKKHNISHWSLANTVKVNKKNKQGWQAIIIP